MVRRRYHYHSEIRDKTTYHTEPFLGDVEPKRDFRSKTNIDKGLGGKIIEELDAVTLEIEKVLNENNMTLGHIKLNLKFKSR